MTAPKYRDDAKGNIAAIKADFIASLRGEMMYGDNFLFCVEDAVAYEEYSNYLTEAEIKSCWKTASRGQS